MRKDALAEAERLSASGRYAKISRDSKRVEDTHRDAKAKADREAFNRDRAALDLEANAYRTNPPSAEELYVFSVDVLGYKDLAPEPHDEMCEFLISLVQNPQFDDDERTYGMMLVPRDCFKSTVGVVCLILYLLVKNPNLTFLIDSYRHDVSKKRLQAIKKHIETNKRFRALFGDWRPAFREDTWNESAINIAGRNASGNDMISIDPTIDTCGVDMPKTGSHPHVIICDDVHNRENVQTPKVRSKVYEHIGEMTPMLQPGGAMLIIGTRWSHHDAYGKIIKEDNDMVKAAAQNGDPYPEKARRYKKLIRGARDVNGNLYFPSRLTNKYLEDARRQPGMTEYLYRSQYFNETIEDSQNLFPSIEEYTFDGEFFHDLHSANSILEIGEDSIPVLTTLAWDTAGHKPTTESDYHGLTVVGCSPQKQWFVLEGVAIKDTPNAVVEKVAAYIMYYRPHTVSVEVVGQSGVWITLLRNYLSQYQLYMPYIVEARPPSTMNKLTRIDTTLEPLFRDDMLHISNKAVDLLNQMEEYPQVDHYDVMDSLAQHYNIVRPADEYDGIDTYDYEFAAHAERNTPPRPRWQAAAGPSSPNRRVALRSVS